MARKTYFVVLRYQRSKKGAFDFKPPYEAHDAEHCRRMAERFVRQGMTGALGFSRSGDVLTGDYEDAVVLCKAGQPLPDEMMDRLAA